MNLLTPFRQRLAGFIAPPANPFASPARTTAPAPAVQAASLPTSLARIIRPQAAGSWAMLPSLGSITPTYIEQTLRGALMGAHVQQWELFDLMQDTWPRLLKNMGELKHGALALNWPLEPDAEEDEAPTTQALERLALVKRAQKHLRARPGHDENGWDGTLKDVFDAWFVGTTVLEVLDWSPVRGDLLPRATAWVHPKHYAWAQEGFLGLTRNAQLSTLNAQLSVLPFPENKFLVSICKSKSGHPLAGALLRPLAWWWCAQNFSADWLLNFAQVFGLPIRWAHYPTGTPQATIDAICAMLQNMGSNAWAAFPEGATVDLKESSKGATGSLPQEGVLDRSDKQCDLLLLGQTLTSDTGGSGQGGGSLALGKVHAGVREANIQGLANFGATVLNEQLIPMLLAMNYGDTELAPRYCPQAAKTEDSGATLEAYGVGVRAGAITPNEEDEKHFRIKLGLPQMSKAVRAEWAKQGGARLPVTLQAEAAPAPNPAPPKGKEVQAANSDLPSPISGFASAVAADLQFALDRLARIAEIQDPALFEQKLREFTRDFPQLKADTLRDPASARALLPMLVKGLERGLTEKPTA